MINFENGTLVLNSIFSKEDVTQINAFTEYVRKQERERIIQVLEDELYDELYKAMVIGLIVKKSGNQE